MFEDYINSVNAMYQHLYKQKYTAKLSLTTGFVLPVVIIAFTGNALGTATSISFLLGCLLIAFIVFAVLMVYYSKGLKIAKEKMTESDYQSLLSKLNPPKKPLKERLSGFPLLIILVILLYLLSLLAMKLEEKQAMPMQEETNLETSIDA